jgi:predicted AAA+ superfamily ATPase
LNYSEIARDASISVDTARRYLEYLRISYQTILLPPYQRNITSSVVKTPKIYWVDIGILRQLTGFRGPHTGETYETMVISELIKWMRTSQAYGELFFYRTRSGLELDGILQTERGIVGIEIKARKELAKKDITTMKEVAAGIGTEWRGGMLIYLGNKIFKIAEPSIWAVPSRRLFAS